MPTVFVVAVVVVVAGGGRGGAAGEAAVVVGDCFLYVLSVPDFILPREDVAAAFTVVGGVIVGVSVAADSGSGRAVSRRADGAAVPVTFVVLGELPLDPPPYDDEDVAEDVVRVVVACDDDRPARSISF